MFRRSGRRIPLQQILRGIALRGLRGLADAGGGVLSPQEIQAYAANAGFAGADLATAVAIALAESVPSGNPNSYNPEIGAGAPQGKGSYGLWQIYLNAHPEFAGWNLYDPQTNANAAYKVYSDAGGFSPWTTFRTGAYRRYLSLLPGAAPAQSSTAPPPLTIDAATGLPIADDTPTPPLASAVNFGPVATAVAAGVVLYLAADFIFGD